MILVSRARSLLLRTFVAIELPSPIRAVLSELLARMKTAFPQERLRWSSPENIHLTLKFLGATPESQIPQIVEALREKLVNETVFRLTPRGVGAFPPRGSPRVVWIGLEGDVERLSETAEAVEAVLNPLGFPREKRPFSPHLTFARTPRNGSGGRSCAVFENLSKIAPPIFPTFQVGRVTLMESKLSHPHSIYTPLGIVPLRGT
jgi:RNA 2',3'-cyclic 3'-phosphodiesterase